jgi:hypothetical protein
MIHLIAFWFLFSTLEKRKIGICIELLKAGTRLRYSFAATSGGPPYSTVYTNWVDNPLDLGRYPRYYSVYAKRVDRPLDFGCGQGAIRFKSGLPPLAG